MIPIECKKKKLKMDVAFQKNLQNENEKCVPQTTFSDKMHNFPVFLFFLHSHKMYSYILIFYLIDLQQL